MPATFSLVVRVHVERPAHTVVEMSGQLEPGAVADLVAVLDKARVVTGFVPMLDVTHAAVSSQAMALLLEQAVDVDGTPRFGLRGSAAQAPPAARRTLGTPAVTGP